MVYRYSHLYVLVVGEVHVAIWPKILESGCVKSVYLYSVMKMPWGSSERSLMLNGE